MRSEGTTELQWPDFYPENCPPTEAKSASGTVYRLVKHNPPRSEDFLSTWEEFPGRFREPTIRISGTSVHRNLQDSEQLKNRIGSLRNRKITQGELNPALGVIQHTPSHEKSHHTWWIPIGAEPWLVFKVIK